MAVTEGEYGVWAVRLAQASLALHPEARWLMAGVGGPLGDIIRMAASDVWGGPFADRLRGALRSLDDQLCGWGEHLGRMERALEEAAREAENAVRLEAAGVVPGFDPFGAVAPWRRWPDPSPPLPSDWAFAAGPGSVGVVWVDPGRARQLAEGMRVVAGQLRGVRSRVAAGLSEVGIDTPAFLEPVATGLEDIAGEVDRRVTLLEQVDRELAGAFQELAAGLGFPGLAPPPTLDPADPLGSSRAGLRAGADAGPGRQPTQAKEADPVSTSTGNYQLEVVDLAQPARGIPTAFNRTYNSLRSEHDGPLGFGWTHSWGIRLHVDDTGMTVVWEDGHEERYHLGGNGTFVAPSGVHRLRRTGAGFELRTKTGDVRRFDADGRLVALADRWANTTVLEYDEGRLTRVTDASGAATTLDHDERGRITAVNGVLERRWTYAYSRRGDLVAVTDPEGAATTYEYDDEHRLVAVNDPEGAVVVRNVYDGLGRVVEQRDGGGGSWRYRYEPAATIVTDPLGHTKSFRFDERYRTTAITDANAATTRFGWDDASNLVAVEDPTGRTFRFAYNARGDLTAAEGDAGTPVSFEWDADGNLTAVVSATGQRAEITWDGASRPVRLVSPAGVTTTVTWRDDGLPESIVDGTGATTRYAFDAAGRLASITDPLGALTTASFDAAGRPVAEAHPGGEATTFTWDHCDRLVAVTDEAGATHRYSYDGCGRLVGVTDPVGRVTRYGYGPLGLLASATDPLGRETTFTYDPCGRLATRRDARGATVSFSYDPAGRLVGIDAPDIVPIRYGWDAAGSLVSMSDATGESTWELDEAGRPVREQRPHGVELLHRYDILGRRDRLELRRGEGFVGAWEYGFDPDGRITGVTDPSGATTRLGYDPAGRLALLRHPNGVATTWTYDPPGSRPASPTRVRTAGSSPPGRTRSTMTATLYAANTTGPAAPPGRSGPSATTTSGASRPPPTEPPPASRGTTPPTGPPPAPTGRSWRPATTTPTRWPPGALGPTATTRRGTWSAAAAATTCHWRSRTTRWAGLSNCELATTW